MTQVSMTVNGKTVSGDVEGRTLLSSFLRDHLSLTGTHVGCDTAQCGACVVHVNGEAVKSCNMLALEADGADVGTIEGQANPDGSLNVIQQAFQEFRCIVTGRVRLEHLINRRKRAAMPFEVQLKATDVEGGLASGQRSLRMDQCGRPRFEPGTLWEPPSSS